MSLVPILRLIILPYFLPYFLPLDAMVEGDDDDDDDDGDGSDGGRKALA